MASCDLTVWSLRATAFRWLRNSINFVMYVLVRTRSLAIILTGPIWPSFAYFFISDTNFCSCFSRFARSRSSSRTALLISRLFFLNTSLSGTFLPQVLPMAAHDVCARLEFYSWCCFAAGMRLRVVRLAVFCTRIVSEHVLHSVLVHWLRRLASRADNSSFCCKAPKVSALEQTSKPARRDPWRACVDQDA